MDNEKCEISAVGNRDVILPFRMIGFNTFPVSHAQGVINTLYQLAMNDYGIVYPTEDITAEIPDTIAYYDTQATPTVILIPTHEGSAGLGLQRVQDNVEKATGQNIL